MESSSLFLLAVLAAALAPSASAANGAPPRVGTSTRGTSANDVAAFPLVPSSPSAAGDEFGWVLSLGGGRALIGSNGQGAHVFSLDGPDSWSHEQRLATVGGQAVAMDDDGDHAIVGSPAIGEPDVRIYERNDQGIWEEEELLLSPEGGGQFGFAVALQGARAVVCAPTIDENQGAAYVFLRSGQTWSFDVKLTDADGAAGDEFCRSVSFDGDRILVGALYRAFATPATTGAALIFAWNGAEWVREARLTTGTGWFGHAVALSGDRALVGAARANGRGAGYFYERIDNVWQLQQTVADGASSSWYGLSVALDGDRAIIGSRYDDEQATDAGAAFVYWYNGVAWELEIKLLPESSAINQFFGDAVATSDNHHLVGARGSDASAGAAFSISFCKPLQLVFVQSGAPANIGALVDVSYSPACSLPVEYFVSFSATPLVPLVQLGDQVVLPQHDSGGTYSLRIETVRSSAVTDLVLADPVELTCDLQSAAVDGAFRLQGTSLYADWLPDATCFFGDEQVPLQFLDDSDGEAALCVPVPDVGTEPVSVSIHATRAPGFDPVVVLNPCDVRVVSFRVSLVVPSIVESLEDTSVSVVGEAFGEGFDCVLGTGYQTPAVFVSRELLVCTVRSDESGPTTLWLSFDGTVSDPLDLEFRAPPTQLVVAVQPPPTIQPPAFRSTFQQDGAPLIQVDLSPPSVVITDGQGGVPVLSDASLVLATVQPALENPGADADLIGTPAAGVNVSSGVASFPALFLRGERGASFHIVFELAGVGVSTASTAVRIQACEDLGEPLIVGDVNDASACTCRSGAEPMGGGCVPCAPGSYKTEPGSERCTACPSDTTSPEGSLSLSSCVCADGYYALPDDPLECLSCPDGATCVDGGATSAAGFWLTTDGLGHPVVFSCDIEGVCLANDTCADGYTGRICGVCAADYGRVGDFCVACPPPAANSVLVGIVVLIGIVALVALVKTATVRGTKLTISLKVFLNYMQVLSLFGQFSAGWPSVVAGAMGLAGALIPTSQTLSFDCALGVGVYDRFVAALLLPVVAVVLSGAALAVTRVVAPSQENAPYYSYLSFFLYLIHPSVSQATLEVLQCRSFGPEGSFLASDLSVSCDTATYTAFFALAVVWLVVYCIGLIAAALWALWRGIETDILVFLVDGYAAHAKYWEVATMARKLLIMLCASVVPTGSSQLFLGLLVLLAALLANARFRPFSSATISGLEDGALFVLLVTLSAAITFRDPETGPTAMTLLAALVILCNAAFVLIFLFVASRWVRKAGRSGPSAGDTPLRRLRQRLRTSSGSSNGDTASQTSI